MKKEYENLDILKKALEYGKKNDCFVDGGKALERQISLEEAILKKISVRDYIKKTEKSEVLKELAFERIDNQIEELKKELKK